MSEGEEAGDSLATEGRVDEVVLLVRHDVGDRLEERARLRASPFGLHAGDVHPVEVAHVGRPFEFESSLVGLPDRPSRATLEQREQVLLDGGRLCRPLGGFRRRPVARFEAVRAIELDDLRDPVTTHSDGQHGVEREVVAVLWLEV